MEFIRTVAVSKWTLFTKELNTKSVFVRFFGVGLTVGEFRRRGGYGFSRQF